MSKYKYSTNQKWTLASSASGAAMQAMDLMFLSLAMKPMVQSLGITNAQGGSIASVTTFGMLFGSLLFGYLADNYGRVKVFMYSIWLFALATAGISFAHDITTIYFLRFLAGMGSGAEFGAGITLITENLKGHHVATFTSYAESFGELGAIFASVLAAWILPTHGWHMLFLFGLIPVILAFLVRLNLKENPRFVHNLKERKADNDKKASILMLFKSRHMFFLTIAMTIMYMIDGASYYGLMNWMPTIMQKQLHINIMQSSLFMVSTIFGVMLGMLIFGKMMDKLGAKKAFSFFFGCSIFVVYLLKFSNSAISLLIASTLVGFFAEACYSGYGVIVSKVFPMKVRVTANGFVESLGKAIGGLSPIMIGFLLDHSGMTGVVLFLSLLPLLSLITILTVIHLDRQELKDII